MRMLIAAVSLMFVCAACGAPETADPATDDGKTSEEQEEEEQEEEEEEEEEQPIVVGFCDGKTNWLWDPASKDLLAFPDDYFTTDDSNSLTGVQVDMRPGQNVKVPASASSFGSVYSDLGRLDGFSVNGAAYLRFSGPLNRAALSEGGLGSGTVDSPIQLVSMDGNKTSFLDFTVELIKESASDDSTTLVVKPLVPLAPSSKYALVVTNGLKDAADDCIAPSPTFKALFDEEPTAPEMVRLKARYLALIDGLKAADAIQSVHDLSAAVVFTTQSIFEVSAAIAADIRTQSIAYTKTDCTTTAGTVFCEGELAVNDYRDASGYIEAGTLNSTPETLTVSIWMPASEGPHPVVLFAHGLGGDRLQAEGLGGILSAGGWAVVAVDAPKHGKHYDEASPPLLGNDLGALELFGASISFMGASINTRKLTANFRQAAYDKLQLVQALSDGIDADEDGTVDLNTDKLVYSGVSLGGIMAPEVLALAPEFDVAIPMVPGARLADIVSDSSPFQQGVGMLMGQATEGDKARMFAVFQAAVDKVDPGSWGPKVLGTRLPGMDAQKPQVLMQMLINDDTVPNSTNAYYARSLGLELAGDKLLELHVPAMSSLPASANLASDLTGAVYQLDIGTDGKNLSHSYAGFSEVSSAQVVPFIQSHYTNVASTVIDSYRTLGVK